MPRCERSEAPVIRAAAPKPSQQAIQCISALKIDGGTSFVLNTHRGQWSQALDLIVDEAQCPPSSSAPFTDWRGVIRTISPSGTPPREALVTVAGPRRNKITLTFTDAAIVEINTRTGRIEVKAKALYLWSHGIRAWLATWLDFISRLALDQGCTPTGAYLLGWRTYNLELCSDFVGLEFTSADTDNFTGKAKSATYNKLPEAETLMVTRRYGKVETIQISRRSSPSSLCIYQKSTQLRTAKKTDPATSMYAPIWRASGHFDTAMDVTRVELRLGSRGLKFDLPDTGEKLDLTNPMSLLVHGVLAQVWRHETEHRRLIVPTNSRTRRCNTDPRWAFVQEVSKLREPPRLHRAREISKLTRQARLAKAHRQLRATLETIADLNSYQLSDEESLLAVAATSLAIDPATSAPGDSQNRIRMRNKSIRQECDEGGREFRRLCESYKKIWLGSNVVPLHESCN